MLPLLSLVLLLTLRSTASNVAVCKDAYSITILSVAPLVAYIHDFLQPGEAEKMIQLTQGRMKPSTVSSVNETEHNLRSQARTSFTTYLKGSETREVYCIEQRAARLQGLPSISFIEQLQVVWYRKGQQFQPHIDWFSMDLMHQLNPGGQRVSTILVYLNNNNTQDTAKSPVTAELKGGETVFPELRPLPHLCNTILNCENVDNDPNGSSLRVRPRKNDAVFWYNAPSTRYSVSADEIKEAGYVNEETGLVKPDIITGKPMTFLHGDPLTLHGGVPVISGEKYAINIWTRERHTRYESKPLE